MASNKLKVQAFRTNDLAEDTGKQFEIGKSWCDFFEIAETVGDVSFRLVFKPISKTHENFDNRIIELQLSGLTPRKDRKAYANGSHSGHSAIKEFFLRDLHLTSQNNSSDYFAIYKASESNYYLYYIPQLLHDNFIRFFESINPTVTINRASKRENNINGSLQQIFYGAPGTGKSHIIKYDEKVKEANEKNLEFRTTFHPDSDYSTFVGAYKPTIAKRAVRNVAGDIVKDTDKEDVYEDCITYSFVPQAFLQAYVAAWNNQEENVFLIIEEINRGNCAQIFGDLFQLLDRDCDGFSEYPIMADKDLEKYLKGKDENGQDILTNKDGIKDGKLKLPSNLYIWATMNTSDQSLFPIDSAFKRRWEWKYIKIAEGRNADSNELLNWVVKFDYEENFKAYTFECSWWEFIKAINEKIADATSSDDKKLGYFFCKPPKQESKEIDAERFVGKVVFYLWNDVFKDEENRIFKVSEDKKEPSFDAFYTENESGKTVADTKALRMFMHNVFGEHQELYTETEKGRRSTEEPQAE